jgi:hypothetical protein
LRSGEVRGILNRICGIPQAPLERLAPTDREYVGEELTAAIASWLSALPCPVLNRPTPALTCGIWRAPAQWRWLAGQVGLPALPWRLASWDEPEPPIVGERAVALVVGGEVVGPVPPGHAAGYLALAQAAATPLLGVTLARDAYGDWAVDDATSIPDLRYGGSRALDALRHALGA